MALLPRRALGLLLVSGFVLLAAGAARFAAADDSDQRQVAAHFVAVQSADNCHGGAGIVVAPVPGAISYTFTYFDGAYGHPVTGSITVDQIKQSTADNKGYRGVPKHDYYSGVTGGWGSPPCKEAKLDPTYGGRFSKGVKAWAVFPPGYKEKPNRITGRLYRLVCNEQGTCDKRAPFGRFEVKAVGAGKSVTTMTKADGSYELSPITEGTWRVEPTLPRDSQRSYPSALSVSTSGHSDTEFPGKDFNVCDTDPPPNEAAGCVPTFDYTMADRYQDSDLTSKYADPDSFAFDAKLAQCDASADYTWKVDGNPADVKKKGACEFEIAVPKLRTYRVEVESDAASYTRNVRVQDLLIASLGDSLASGEGNPPYLDPKVGLSRDCDQSSSAYGRQTGYKAEQLDPRSSVTFLFLACSGALLREDPAGEQSSLGQLVAATSDSPDKPPTWSAGYASYLGAFTHGEKTIFKQVDQLHSLVGKRRIDGLTITIGINDLHWLSLITACATLPDCQTNKIVTRVEDNLISDLGDNYDALSAYLKKSFPDGQLDPADVYLVGYPDPLHETASKLCDEYVPGFTGDEVAWAERDVVDELQTIESRAARRNGWHFVSMSGTGFLDHGGCSTDSWWYSVQDAIRDQHPSGAFHPNRAGIAAEGAPIVKAVTNALLPGGVARKPG
ncbi:MAG TPA: SGNH/GDSL hydrolase family protein [Gaiellaceae bacterium]|nr:SGNH/GDSL hydrolase family protein [Gaiellaceae bacterium]